MSALLTHAAVGVVLGLALGLRWRWLPLAAFIACFPDLDHLPVPGFVTRGTLTNVFVCVLLPLAVYAVLAWRKANPEAVKIAAAAPLLLLSHLFLDMVPLDTAGDSQNVKLFYPIDGRNYTLRILDVDARVATDYSTFTIAFGVVILVTLATILAIRWIGAQRPYQRLGPVPAAHILAWIVLLPTAMAPGLVIPTPEYPNAQFAVEDARAEVPQMRFVGVVHQIAGRTAGVGAINLTVYVDGAPAAWVRNPAALPAGARWPVDITVRADLRAATTIEAKVVSMKGEHAYAAVKVPLRKGHVDVPLVLGNLEADAQGRVSVPLANQGALDVPANALRITVTQPDGAILSNETHPERLPGGGTLRIRLPVPAGLLSGPVTIEVRAVDDGHRYVRETRP
jgi:membrane-bound metal-dependent hydrolase YbcI (DUF457 family)